MSKHIYLVLAIHNHQPVGNFDHVFAEAYDKAYAPMVDILERHPGIRLALHYTGPLRDWLVENRPEFLPRIAALVERGQVEIMTGGYYEPILPSIPDADKLGQIARMTSAVQKDFGYQPRGAWLAERVWEPHLAKPLAQAGVEYIIVDDTHFKWVGLEDEDLFGYYVTEEQGATLKILPTSKHLRYSIPWATVDEVMDYLREEAVEHEDAAKAAIMGDDGEKFGLWPGTYQHIWEKGWMERFFQALEENADWVETIPPGEYARRFPALGRIYLPTTSYDEMTEWALPPALSGQIVTLKHRLQNEGREDILRFVRGGFWRNFLVKYPEVNDMHKKMLRVHDKVYDWIASELPGNVTTEVVTTVLDRVRLLPPDRRETILQALSHLWAGQCNCPYWHGVFGGIYLSHIRTANYQRLIAAENLADQARHGGKAWVEVTETDFDRDSHPELLVESQAMSLYFNLQQGGSLFEWDWRAKNFNLLNNLSRRPEGYHHTLRELARKEESEQAEEEGETVTIHEIVQAKEKGLDRFLHYDWYRRTALIDHCLPPGKTLEDFQRADYNEAGDFVNQPYAYQVEGQNATGLRLVLRRDGHLWVGEVFAPLRVEKRLRIEGGRTELPIAYTLTNTGPHLIKTRFGVEFNFGLLSGHAPDAFYRLPGLDNLHLDAQGEVEDLTELALVHQWFGLEIELRLSRPALLWHMPIETISSSESGFERVYQCSCIMPLWEIGLEPGESWQVEMKFVLR